MAEHKTKTFQYRNARFMSGDGTLGTLLTKAKKKCGKIGQRKEPMTAEGDTFRVVNQFRSSGKMIFGSLLIYSPGKHQQIIVEDDEAEEIPIDQLAPPTLDGKKRDFIESILYFGVLGNHAVVVQSHALKARQLEDHINWLLGERGKLMKGENRVMLAHQPPKKQKTKIRKAGVKKVTIAAELEATPVLARKGARREQRSKFLPTGVGFNLLKQVVPSFIDELQLHDSLDESNLRVRVDVSFVRQTSDDGQNMLNNLAVAARNVMDDIEVELKGGGKLRGDELQLQGASSVKLINGVIDVTDLYPKMKDWLQQQIERGLVE